MMNRSRTTVSLTIAALAGAVLMPAGVATAADSSASQTVGYDGDAPPAADVADASVIAEGLGISETEARAAYMGQDDFLVAVSAAYSNHPDEFFSSGWTPERLAPEGYKGWVSFAGGVSDATIESFAQLPVPVEVRFDAPASANALEAVREATLTTLYEIIPGVIGLTGDFEEDGDLVVEYEVKPSVNGITETTQDVVSSVVTEFERSAPIDITVRQNTGIAAEGEIVRGGTVFGGCTLGFAARRGTQPGAVTAGHCSNSSATPAESSTSMPFVTEHVGSYGDAQFHSTTDGLSSAIRINTSATRTITGVAYPSNGASVCNFDKTRVNSACTTIRNWNHAFTNENGVYLSRMAQSNGSFTNGGDSGGPWYSGSIAIGVHYGKSGGYSTMSRVADVQAILSISIARN